MRVHSTRHESDFVEFTASMRLPIAPMWSPKARLFQAADQSGVEEAVVEILDGWTMRYLPAVQGVLVSFDHRHIKLLHPTVSFDQKHDPQSQKAYPAWHQIDSAEQDEEAALERVSGKSLPIIEGTGFMLVDVAWRGVAWKPRIGQQLAGVMSLSTPSHVSLIVHNLFNASIPSTHIPKDYEFDPDYQVPSAVQQRKAAMPFLSHPTAAAPDEDSQEREEEDEAKSDGEEQKLEQLQKQERQEEKMYAERGWWVHKRTRQPLGGQLARTTFTITGLTVASSMISCTGSLLTDPYSVPTKENEMAKVTKRKKSKRQGLPEQEQVVHANRDQDESEDNDDSDKQASDPEQDEDEDEPPVVREASPPLKKKRKSTKEQKDDSSKKKRKRDKAKD